MRPDDHDDPLNVILVAMFAVPLIMMAASEFLSDGINPTSVVFGGACLLAATIFIAIANGNPS